MNIVMAGLLISVSGMTVIAAAIFGVIPPENKPLQYAFIAIGWVFVIIGMIVRWKGMKMEREQEKRRKQNRK
ncbi:hypothetical protein AAGS61_11255 [Lysinibacillus sp. KU-BSD001]|uniref:hypothetical protein n=1 Tax=Lysinibacillus sp. KU-BSD001 TaxID=3141328 RepID=UPI0036E1C5DA